MIHPLKVANRQILTAQIATLDFEINRLVTLVNAASYKTGSLFLSGRSGLQKDFNEIITWREGTPIPKMQLRNFLQHYNNHLIYQRNICVAFLEKEETLFLDQTRIHPCRDCLHDTLQRNYFIIGGGTIIPAPGDTWICNECETIIKEV